MIYIYLIENTEHKLFYIGQTIDVARRYINHKCCANKPGSSRRANKLNKAFWELGFDSFEFSVLCEVDSQETADSLERKYISEYSESHESLNTQAGGRKYYNPNNTDSHKQCYRCKKLLPNSAFASYELGRNNSCKECERVRNRDRMRRTRLKALAQNT